MMEKKMILKDNQILEISLVEDGIISFDIPKDTNIEVSILFSINDGISPNIAFNIAPYSSLKLIMFVKGEGYKLSINLQESASLIFFNGDALSDKLETIKEVNLQGREAKATIYEFTPANNQEIVNGVFHLNHLSENTQAHGDFIFLSKDQATIKKDVVSNIPPLMKNSISSENIKGVILSKEAKINAKPILKIGLDDVHASHGCAIGTLNDNEIYYLMSRGLSKDDAIKIITKALVTPIINASSSLKFQKRIQPYLEQAIGSE